MAGKDRSSFKLGFTCVTPKAAARLAPERLMELFSRHSARDWGDLQPEDASENDRNADQGGRVRSVYHVLPELNEGESKPEAGPNPLEVWVITEPDRFDSVLMLPEEYIAWESGDKQLYRERLKDALKLIPGRTQANRSDLPKNKEESEIDDDFLAWIENSYTSEVWEEYHEKRFEKRGSISPGLDRMTDEFFRKKIDEFRKQLLKTIKDRTFRFRFFQKLEHTQLDSSRIVVSPTIRDRFLDYLLGRYLSKRFNSPALPQIHALAHQIQARLKDLEDGWFYRTDLKSFFDSIEHARLFKWLESRGLSPETRLVIEELAKTPRITRSEMIFYRTNHSKTEWEQVLRQDLGSDSGLPQGLYASGIIAEAWLSDWLARHPLPKGVACYRYVDDFLFLAKKKARRSKLESYLKRASRELGLAFSQEKTQFGQIREGFDYIGFNQRPNQIGRSAKSLKRFKLRWIEALENPLVFLESKMDPWYLHSLIMSTEDNHLRNSLIFGLVVYFYNLSIIGWSRSWEPEDLYEYDNLQIILSQISTEQVEISESEIANLRERFADLSRDLFQVKIFGSAAFNAICTDSRQIDELNRWAGRLFASFAARHGLGRPRLEDHLKWYFFYRKPRKDRSRKVLEAYARIYGEKRALIEGMSKDP